MRYVYSPNLSPGDKGVMVRINRGDDPKKFAKGGLVRAARTVRGAGRFGDDMLIHLNKSEFEQLRRAWGEPTINPDTGLPEYFWGALIGSLAAGLLSGSHSSGNATPAPPTDPNFSRPLPHFVDRRTVVSHPNPSSYFTYGQTDNPHPGEMSFFGKNSLANVGGKIPPAAPQGVPTTGVPDTASGGLGVVGQLLKNPSIVKKLTGLFHPASPAVAGLYNPATYDAITGVSGTGAGAAATAAQGIGDLTTASNAPGALAALADSTPSIPASAFGGAGAGAGAGGLGTVGTMTPAYQSAISEALGTDLGGAGTGASAGSGAGSGAGAGAGVAGGAAALWAYALYRAMTQDKQDDTPYRQVTNGLMQNGVAGQHIGQELINTAAKYGDPADPASWDMTKWSAADQAAHNNGQMSLEKKGGVGQPLGFAMGGLMGGMRRPGMGMFSSVMQRPPLGRQPLMGPPGGGEPLRMQPNPGMSVPGNPGPMPPGIPLPPRGGLSIPGGPPGNTGPMPPGIPMPPHGSFSIPGNMGPTPARPMMASGGHISGPGTGRSDDIPAKLSDGEYVMDAETVSLLGDGSTQAGASRLDELRRNLRAHKGRTLAKGKFSPKARHPGAYMGKGVK